MICQELYDLRERTGFCSGSDLHEFFRKEVGEPSPSGKQEVNADKAKDFVKACINAMKQRSPDMGKQTENETHNFIYD